MPLSKELEALLKQVRLPTNDLRNRAAVIFENPGELNQDAFGICGMAAVVYVMLRTNPTAVVDLLGDLFGKGRQNLATMTDGDPPAMNQLARYYRNRNPKDRQYQLDFFVCRYLGVLMERHAPEVFEKQKQFTRALGDAMGGAADDPLDMTQGNLAIHFDGMQWMVDRHLWAGRSKQLKVSPAWPGAEPLASMQQIVRATTDHYVISAQDFKDLTPPMFSHWVVLLGVTSSSAGVDAPVKWRPNEFSRGQIVDYSGVKIAEAEFRQFYPRLIMADT